MAAILNFRIFAKDAKTQNCLESPKPLEIEQFRQNFQPPGCLRTKKHNFSKNFQKMVAILNFRIFAKNVKTQNFCYLLNC